MNVTAAWAGHLFGGALRVIVNDPWAAAWSQNGRMAMEGLVRAGVPHRIRSHRLGYGSPATTRWLCTRRLGAAPVAMVLLVPSLPPAAGTYLPGRNPGRSPTPDAGCHQAVAVAHLLANGMLADVLLFGAFLVWRCWTASR